MIYNMEKIDRVIAKVVTDLGLGQDDIPYADMIEWIADALQHIGAYPQLEQKHCTVLIDNYEGILPCDVYKVIRMRNGCEVRPGSGGFYGGTLVDSLNKLGVDYESLDPYERWKIVAVPGLAKIDNQFDYYSGITNRLQHNGNLIGDPTVTRFSDADFNINFNKVTTGFCHGIIELQYLSFPVDERGYPLVPDDVSFRDALFWKVAYQMSMRNPAVFKQPRLQDMEYCRQQWNRCCMQARAAANMPDVAMLERMKNNWLRLYNVPSYDNQEYRGIGKQQSLGLDGKY